MGAKTFVIGYDGGTLDVIEPLAAGGFLPTFASLMKNGAYGRLKSVYPPLSAPAWASFMTGKNPGNHSVYNFNIKPHGSYYLEPALSTSIDSLTLWEILSQQDKRVAVINVPLTFPLRKVNGIMVSGLGTPDSRSDFIYPPSLVNALKTLVPDYIMDVGWTRYSNAQIPHLISDLKNLTRQTHQVAKFCLSQEDWDFFMVVFVGPDRLQHRLWNQIAENLIPPFSAPKENSQIQHVRDYFSHLDTHIADLIADLDNDSTIFVLSDHGFGPFLKDFDLNNWLAANGFLTYTRQSSGEKDKLLRYLKTILKSLGVSKDFLISKFKNSIDIYKYIEKTATQSVNIDWQKTKAFCFTSHSITINLKGRERNGIVKPGKEYHDIVNQIIFKLLSLTDPETKIKVVEEVKHINDIYHNAKLLHAPDILITKYNNAGYIGLERIFRKENDDRLFFKTAAYQTGVHRLDGFFICHGENIKQNYIVKNANIMDLFPTILTVNNCDIPDDIDGKVLTSIFRGLDKKSPRFSTMVWDDATNGSISEQEKSKIAQRLKDLGYM